MDLNRAIQTFDFYLSSSNYSENTRRLYQYALHILSDYLGEIQLQNIRSPHMEKFWSYLRNEYTPKRLNKKSGPLAGRSLENIWTAERTFFRWALETGKIKKRPDLKIQQPVYSERIIQPFTEEEVKLLLQSAQYTKAAATHGRKSFRMARKTAKRDTALIMLLAETGIRVSECARLTWGDVDFQNCTITIQPFGTGRKTKFRILSIGSKPKLALWEYLIFREKKEQRVMDLNSSVFMSVKGNPMNRNSIRCVLDGIGQTAGVHNVHPHRFRHFYTSQRAADHVNEYVLMSELGNTTDKMVRRYIHLNDIHRQKKSIIDRLI